MNFVLIKCFVCLLGRKIIRSVWFEHAYCGLALGFAKEHRTRESYVRCLLCKQDVKIASRGITTFWEHCRGFRHHRLDCLIRLRRGLPLRKRDGTLMSVTESDRCVANLAGEMVPVVEVCPNMSVAEVLQAVLNGRSVWGESQSIDGVSRPKVFGCLYAWLLMQSTGTAILLAISICGIKWLLQTPNIQFFSDRLVEIAMFWLL